MNKVELKLCKKAFDYNQKKEELDKAKEELNRVADKYFSKVGSTVFESDESVNHRVKVTRCRRSKIKFNIEKMEKALPKKVMKRITIKTVVVEDYLGLSNYLKTLGADPKVVKSFLSVSKNIDEKEFNQQYDLGEFKLEDVKGCYEISLGNPYYTVSVK